MIKGTRNQLYNIHNSSQGETKKVLAVCSAGLLRSATLQNFLIKEYGYNVRNCGTNESYALIPISEALLKWADEVVFVNKENYNNVLKDLVDLKILNKCYVLNIPDIYEFNDPRLIEECKIQYNNITIKLMDKLTIFINRLKKLNINIELIGNYPWIYIDKINGIKVTEKFEAEHGFTVAFLPVMRDRELYFTNIKEIFKLIRKYTSCEICSGRNYHKMSCPKIK